MRKDTVRAIAVLLIVNLFAWGGYTYLQEDPTKEYIEQVIYQQPYTLIANVSVTIDYNGAEANSTKNTNTTIITYNVTVVNDTSAYAATLEAGKDNFEVIITWSEQFGAYVHAIDGIGSSDNHYWALYHNGNYASLGATDLKLQEGDTITWKFESS